jgi:hypothetical protein
MKAIFVDGIRRIRPAPLASALAHITSLNRREFVHTEHGTFFVAPMSQLGFPSSPRRIRGSYNGGFAQVSRSRSRVC